VCTEAQANLFSLSPNVVNQEGISSLPKLVQAVFRVARALAPSVIYIDEAEKVFMSGKGAKKKKGEAGAGKSTKIKKDLLAQLKELEPTDRVLVIGNSSSPWDAEFKEISAFFRTMICCVHPDYSSRLLLWQSRCVAKGAPLKDEDYEVLAYMSNKYSSGTIIRIIDETLTDRRVKRVKTRPVSADEFLPAMSKARPIFKEEYEAMKEFTSKLPLDCRRARFPTDFEQQDVDDGKKKKAPGKKKKG
jgi:SpoVK/Ycf46/Vps4 family AAA+-type ATPase